ncbi:cytochrome c oxidase subunit I [Halobaculum limi]|uniref:cytochrome c oxidase subunit I n=1 Tax=Halobaculum limi TaxID=3031916 RepID=UPI0024056F11|nr:cbb3-type cytochrome c oxidase subunit I [Halobaculum sp. YSMS11]
MSPRPHGSPRRLVPTGLVGWLTTVDHRRVGILYLVFASVAGLWGAVDAMVIRTALLTPQATLVEAATYDELFTTHGLTMVFLFATPGFFGLANVVVPPLIGADEMAFPRANATAVWLLPPSILLVRAGTVALALPGVESLAPVALGWTLYPPLSTQSTNPAVDLTLLGLHLSGVGTILASINVVVTVITERAPAVTWDRLDLFTWSMLVAAGLAMFAFPILGSALLMLLLDRNVGTTYFAVDGGGPMLWQHLFWFWGHPEVYVLALPAMGVISHVLPKFAGRELFGRNSVVYSTLAVGTLSFGVWAHHMFTTGLDPRLKASFMAVTLAIGVPSAVKTFNWIATLWNGSIRLTAPMLFCLGAVATFVLGGVTGVFLASIPIDIVLHDTFYVVGHFHLMLVGLTVFGAFAAVYYWFPLLTGRLYDPFLARLHFWCSVTGVLVTFLPLLLIGLDGLPRRTATYPATFATAQRVSTVGAYLLGAGQLAWLVNVAWSALAGPRVSGDVWDLGEARTREWIADTAASDDGDPIARQDSDLD